MFSGETFLVSVMRLYAELCGLIFLTPKRVFHVISVLLRAPHRRDSRQQWQEPRQQVNACHSEFIRHDVDGRSDDLQFSVAEGAVGTLLREALNCACFCRDDP